MGIEKRLAEIQERAAAILAEMEGEVTEERMAELEQEQAALEAENNALRRKMELRGRLADMDPGEQAPADGPDAGEQEARARQVKETGRMEISAAEVRAYMERESRAVLIATGKLTEPTGTGNVIRDLNTGVSSIVDQVYVSDLTGCAAFEEAFVKTESEAGSRQDGQAGTESTPTFGIAKILPTLINTTSYVSKNISRVNPLAYEEKVRSLALKALRVKAAALIASGDGANFYGIKTAVDTDGDAMFKKHYVEAGKITEFTLREITFQYGGNDELGGNARLFLTKEDLAAFGAVRGTNEKKAIYEIKADPGNANTGTIQDGGVIVPYTLLSSLESLSTAKQGTKDIDTMLYGDPMNFELGLFGPYSVEVSRDYKFAEGLHTIMGEAMLGGNLIVKDGFVIVSVKAKAGG